MALQAFAVYSANDNSLNFYKRDAIPNVGEQFENKIVTNIYTGVETLKCTSNSQVPWYSIRSSIKNIKVVDIIKPASTAWWFYQCSNLKSVDLPKLDTTLATDMKNMFYGCYNLTSLDASELNTASTTNMSSMFYNCSRLTSLDVSTFNTNRVTDMSNMFYNCSRLTSLDVSTFNTNRVTSFAGMFRNCSKLISLDVSNFHTYNARNQAMMFSGCRSITFLDLSNFNTERTMNMTGAMSNMFENCISLKKIKLGNKFKFKTGENCYLPEPSPAKIPNADGKWYNSKGQSFTPKEIPSNVADAYYASKDLIPKIPKATMYASVNNKARKITNAYVGAPGSVQLTMTNVETYFDTSNQGVYSSWDYPSYDKYTVRPGDGSLLAKNDTNMSFDYELYSYGGITGLYNFYINSELICIFDASSRTTGKWSGTLPNGTAFTYEAKKNTDITDEMSAGIETRAPNISVYFTFSNIQVSTPSMPAVACKIKKAYIGVPTQIPIYEEHETTTTKDVETLITPSNISNFFTRAGNSYTFIGDSSGKFTSTNQGAHSTNAKSTWTAKKQIKKLTFSYRVSSEENYDKYSITVGGTIVANNISGNGSNQTYSGSLSSGGAIVLRYSKDGSTSSYDDCGTIWDIKVTTAETVTTTEKVQVGTETKEVARLCYQAPPPVR